MYAIRSAIILIVLSSASCGHTPLAPGHHISIDEAGRPLGHFYDAFGQQQFGVLNSKQYCKLYIDPIIAGIEKHVEAHRNSATPAKVLLFIHGGLNGYDEGRDHVLDLLKAQAEPHLNLSSYYLVSINWEASLQSALRDYFFRIRAGEYRPIMAPLTSPFVFAGALGESVINMPRDMIYAYLGDFFTQQGPQLGATGVLGGMGGTEYAGMISVAGGPAFSEIIFTALPAAGAAYSLPLVLSDLTYYLFGPIRMLSGPFIDGFGTPAWDMLKRRPDFVLFNPEIFIKEGEKRGAGLELLKRLAQKIKNGNWITEKGDPIPIELTLVGHSMGAVVSDRILQTLRDELFFNDIIYMGAANSIADFHLSVVPYLQQHTKSNFWSFSLSDRDERDEKYTGDLLMRGSLLVWIELLFEPQYSLLHRRFGRSASQDFVIINTERDETMRPDERIWPRICRVTFSGDRDKEEEPQKHGDFTKPSTLEKMLSIVRRGCPQPADINSATKEELSNVPGLPPDAIDRIIDLRPYDNKGDLTDRQVLSDHEYQCIKHYLAQVNINSATAEQLARLLRGDMYLASKIVKGREKRLYQHVDELDNILKRSIYDQIKDKVTVRSYEYEELIDKEPGDLFIKTILGVLPFLGPQSCIQRGFASEIQRLYFDSITGGMGRKFLARIRREDIFHQLNSYRQMVIQEIKHSGEITVISEAGEKMVPGTRESSWDVVLEIGGKRVGLEIRTSAQLGEYGDYSELPWSPEARAEYVHNIATHAKLDNISTVFSVWDKNVFKRRGMDVLPQLGTDVLGHNLVMLYGRPKEVVNGILTISQK